MPAASCSTGKSTLVAGSSPRTSATTARVAIEPPDRQPPAGGASAGRVAPSRTRANCCRTSTGREPQLVARRHTARATARDGRSEGDADALPTAARPRDAPTPAAGHREPGGDARPGPRRPGSRGVVLGRRTRVLHRVARDRGRFTGGTVGACRARGVAASSVTGHAALGVAGERERIVDRHLPQLGVLGRSRRGPCARLAPRLGHPALLSERGGRRPGGSTRHP